MASGRGAVSTQLLYSLADGSSIYRMNVKLAAGTLRRCALLLHWHARHAVVPYEVAGAATVNIQITTAGAPPSAPFPVKLISETPAIFTADGSGTGQAAALNGDYSYNSKTHPAPKGGFVVLFLTGEGLTTAAVTGRITTVSTTGPLTPLPVASPLTVAVGGQQATLAFYGEAPGLIAGVLQVNAQLPVNIPSGTLPVSVSLAGVSTQSGVTIAVQ